MVNSYLRELLHFALHRAQDRKSTRLNSSHGYISYAVFCLKKKKKYHRIPEGPWSRGFVDGMGYMQCWCTSRHLIVLYPTQTSPLLVLLAAERLPHIVISRL